MYGGFSLLLWAGAFLCFIAYGIQVRSRIKCKLKWQLAFHLIE